MESGRQAELFRDSEVRKLDLESAFYMQLMKSYRVIRLPLWIMQSSGATGFLGKMRDDLAELHRWYAAAVAGTLP